MLKSVSRRLLIASCVAGAAKCCYGRQFGFGTKFVFLNRQRCDRCPTDEARPPGAVFSEPVTSTGTATLSESQPPVTAPTRSTLSAPRSTRIFEFEPITLVSGECLVSDLIIKIDDQGNWSASLIAANRPKVSASAAPRFEFRVDLTTEFKQDSALRPENAWFDDAGPQLVARQEFWIKRGDSRRVVLSGKSLELQTSFNQLDEFTAAFSWRLG